MHGRGSADPLVSVFLFSRNGVESIRRSVESVLGQTYRNFEYVIQDAASTDGTLEVLREYDDPCISLRSEPDTGPMDGFFRALRRCRGQYVCACLCDEELLPTAVEEAVAALEADPEAVGLSRDVYVTDLAGALLATTCGQPFDLVAYMAGRFCPQFASAMFRRTALERAGLNSRTWDLECGEFELWCRLALVGPIRYLPGVAAKYAFHDGQSGRSPANAARLARGRMRMIDVIAEDTRFFDRDPALQASCRTGNGLLFANHLLSLGADEAAIDLYVDLADQSCRLPPTIDPAVADEAFVSAARGQLVLQNDSLARKIVDVALRLAETRGEDHSTITPAFAAAIPFAVARTYTEQQRTDRAFSMLDWAVSIDPGCRDAYWERGVLLEARGEIDDALAAWRASDVFRDPDRHSRYLVASIKSDAVTNQSLLDAHRDWAERHAIREGSVGFPPLPSWNPGERINIGYASAMWETDTVAFQLLPILRRHDRNRFKVTAYTPFETSARVAAAVDDVRIIGALSNEEYVRRVRSDDVHVLVEINGHTPGHRLAAMGARCAPVQVSYLNYTSTCGVEAVDYLLADDISVPKGSDHFYTEEVYRLPGCFFCFTYEDADLPPVSAPASARAGFVTFGCFGSGCKINNGVIALWADVLRAVPGSRLIVRNGDLVAEDNRRALARKFARWGVDSGTVMILPGTTRRGVLESYANVDISLDTVPYCGGNTIAESLWQGVPVITLKGSRFSSAYGASLLTASGLPELIASSPDDYVARAAALAGDSVRLARYRSNLRRMVKEHGFSDAERFTRRLEDAYVDMLARRAQRTAARIEVA